MNDKEKKFIERVNCGIAYCEDIPNKQIEEMANDLVEIFDKEYQKRGLLTPTFTAKQLCELGYQKVNKDSVVLSKEEYDDLRVGKDFNYGYHEGEKNMEAYYENFELPEARKETASEIFETLLLFLDGETFTVGKELKKVRKKIIKMAKEMGADLLYEELF